MYLRHVRFDCVQLLSTLDIPWQVYLFWPLHAVIGGLTMFTEENTNKIVGCLK